jgi:hypothetical protein
MPVKKGLLDKLKSDFKPLPVAGDEAEEPARESGPPKSSLRANLEANFKPLPAAGAAPAPAAQPVPAATPPASHAPAAPQPSMATMAAGVATRFLTGKADAAAPSPTEPSVDDSRNTLKKEFEDSRAFLLSDEQAHPTATNHFVQVFQQLQEGPRPGAAPLPGSGAGGGPLSLESMSAAAAAERQAQPAGPTVGRQPVIAKVLADDENVGVATTYFQGRRSAMNAEYKRKVADLERKYKVSSQGVSNAPVGALGYDAEMATLNKEYSQRTAQFEQAASRVMAQKVTASEIKKHGAAGVWKADPLEVGMKMAEAMGDAEKVARIRRTMAKGAAVPPEDKADIETLGYQTLQAGMNHLFAEGRDEAARSLAPKVENYRNKVLEANPEYAKPIIITRLSDRIYQNASAGARLLGYNGNVTDEMVREAARAEGLTDEQIRGITAKDIEAPNNPIMRGVGSFINNTAAPLYEGMMRHIVAPIAGTDKDALDAAFPEGWETRRGPGRLFTGGTPESMGNLFESDTRVDMDPTSPTYLARVKNESPTANRFRWDVGAVGNVVSGGFGQIAGMATGAKMVGGALNAVGIAKANRAALATWSYLSGFDRNYKAAEAAVGEGGDKSNTLALANMYTMFDIVTEQILPDSKIADRILGNPAVRGELLDILRTNGVKGLKKEMLSGWAQKAIKTGGVDWVKESSEDVLSTLGNTFADMVLAPGQYANTNVGEAVQQAAVTSAIASFLPTVTGGVKQARRQSPLAKQVVFEVGSNPTVYLAEIDRMEKEGNLNRTQAEEKRATVNLLGGIVANSVPTASLATGEDLSHKTRVEYANNLFLKAVAETERKKVEGDTAQVEYIDGLIKDLADRRREHIANVEPVPTPDSAPAPDSAPIEVPVGNEFSDEPLARRSFTQDENGVVVEQPGLVPAAQEGAPAEAARPDATPAEEVVPTPPATPAAAVPPADIPAARPNATAASPLSTDESVQALMNRIRRAESKTDRDKNPDSSATGRYQFVEDTWIKLYERNYNAAGMSRDEILAKRYDPEAQEKLMRVFTRGNAAILRNAGYTDSPGNLYLAHFLGASGAKSVLGADPSTPIEKLVSADAMRSNRSILQGKTAADIVAWAAKKMGGPAPAATKAAAQPGFEFEQEADDEETVEEVDEEVGEEGDREEDVEPVPVNQEPPAEQPGAENAATDTAAAEPTALPAADVPVAGEAAATPAAATTTGQSDLPPLAADTPPAQPTAESQTSASPSVQAEADSPESFWSRPLTEEEQAATARVGGDIREKWNAAPKQVGLPFRRTLPSGDEVEGRYVLTVAGAATPSHNAKSFSSSAGFPLTDDGRNPNDRDYTKPDAQTAVITRSQKYNGLAVENPPLVDRNGIVVDGNDRTMSGQLAAEQGTDDAYVDSLRFNAPRYGFTAAQVDEIVASGQRPRLMAVADPVMDYGTGTFALFNKDDKKAKSDLESITQLQRTFPEELLGRVGGEMEKYEEMSKLYANRGSVGRLLEVFTEAGLVSPDNVVSFFNRSTGTLTPQGKTLVEHVLFSQAMDEDAAVIIREYPDLMNKVGRASKNLVALEGTGEFGLKGTLSATVRLWHNVDQYMEKVGMSATKRMEGLELFMQQMDMFDQTQEQAATLLLYDLLANDTGKGGKKKLQTFTGEMVRRARAQGNGMDLFGGETEDRYSILDKALKVAREYEDQQRQLREAAQANAGQPGPDGRATLDADDATPDGAAEGTPPPDAQGSDAESAQSDAAAGAVAANPGATEVPALVENPELNEAIEEYNKYLNAVNKKEDRVAALESEPEDTKEYRDNLDKERQLLHNAVEKLAAADKRVQAARRRAKDKVRPQGESRERVVKSIRGAKITAGRGLIMSNPLQIPVAFYNMAVETVALAVEAGYHIAAAVQRGIDLVNERHFKTWDEDGFRTRMGEKMEFPLTPAELRDKKASTGEPNKRPAGEGGLLSADEVNSGALSTVNRRQADALIDDVATGKRTLDDVLKGLEAVKVGTLTKNRLRDYIKAGVEDRVYTGPGRMAAEEAIANNSNDWDAALRELEDSLDMQLLNATSEADRENARRKFAAARAHLGTQKTLDGIENGTITQTSIMRPEAGPDAVFGMGGRAQAGLTRFRVKITNRYARLQQIQKALAAFINDQTDALSAMRLARPKAWAKINKMMEWMGLDDKRPGSFVDRVLKAGVDMEKFNLWQYARHAPERNADNAIKRQAIHDAEKNRLLREMADLNLPVETRRRIEGLVQLIRDNKDPIRRAQLEAQLLAEQKGDQYLKLATQLQRIETQQDRNFLLMPDGGSGMTNKVAQEILDEAEADGMTERYEKFADEFRENVIKPILEVKYKTGYLDDEEYQRLLTHYKYYVPLKVDLDKLLGVDDGTGEALASREYKSGKDLYRSTGAAEISYRDRTDVMLQSMRDLEHSFIKGEENLALIRLANLIRLHPDERYWQVVPARSLDIKDPSGRVVERVPIGRPPGALEIMEKGVRSYIVVKDPGLQNAFKRMKPSTFLKVMSMGTAVVRTFATITNPVFTLINPLLDIQDAAQHLLSKQGNGPELLRAYAKNLSVGKVPGIGHSVIVAQLTAGRGKWHDELKEMEADGGRVTFKSLLDLDTVAKNQLKVLERYQRHGLDPREVGHIVANALGRFQNATELATRVAVYKSARDVGMSREQAALLARDATIDFEKSGVYGPAINAFKAFANAALQGTGQIVRSLKSRRIQVLSGALVGSGWLAAQMADSLTDCDDDPKNCYWNLEEYKKQKNFVFPLAAVGGKGFLTPPAGRKLGWFHYMGHNAYGLWKHFQTEGKRGNSPGEFMKHAIESAMDYFNPAGGTAPIEQQMTGNFGSLVGYATNKNAFGAPVTPENTKGLPEHLNSWGRTGGIYKDFATWLSEKTGGSDVREGSLEINPANLEHLFQSVFSGLYSSVKGAVVTATADDVSAGDIPLVNRFYRPSNMGPTREEAGNLIDLSERNKLTQEERDRLVELEDELVEGGVITEESKGKALNYMNRNQTRIINRAKSKSEGDDDDDEGDSDKAAKSGGSDDGGDDTDTDTDTDTDE